MTEQKIVMIDKVQRQNAAALVRQDYEPVKAILAAVAKGDDLTKYQEDEALCQDLKVRGTRIEAVIDFALKDEPAKAAAKPAKKTQGGK